MLEKKWNDDDRCLLFFRWNEPQTKETVEEKEREREDERASDRRRKKRKRRKFSFCLEWPQRAKRCFLPSSAKEKHSGRTSERASRCFPNGKYMFEMCMCVRRVNDVLAVVDIIRAFNHRSSRQGSSSMLNYSSSGIVLSLSYRTNVNKIWKRIIYIRSIGWITIDES